MSNLLERAIVDAKALKEAALKNAEQLVIEKYSQEVKGAVDKLLEQADALSGMSMGGGDPSAGLDMDMGAGLPMDSETPALDADQPEEEKEPLDPDSVLGSIPDAFDTDDDQIINIKLDSLDVEYEDEDEVGVFGGDDEYGEEEIGIDILDPDDQGAFEDFEDEEDEIATEDPARGIGVNINEDEILEALEDLGIDAEEVDLAELMERVRVDFEPQKSGWAGTPEPIMKEYEAMLVAREQDSEVKEENEELRKAVASLKQENKTMSSAATKLQKQNTKYETAFNTLREKLETMNVSNAKLLYINQALENASLNERQKRKIVEAISKAETVQEAKIVFETASDTVSTTSDVKKNATLNEVVSRRSSLLVAARNEQPNKDANPLFNRMQKLAGIKTQ
jgi:hypothetical protein